MSSTLRPATRDAPLSSAAVMLTAALDVSGVLDNVTLSRFRTGLTNNLATHFDTVQTKTVSFVLEADVKPPKPLLAAAFSVRVLWSQWFDSLSPTGAAVTIIIRDDRRTHLLPTNPSPFGINNRAASPVSSLGRSSSCSSMRSAASSQDSASTGASSVQSSANCSPTMPLVELANLNLGNGIIPVQLQQRRVRRQRGGVKQKQRGIHVDKSRLEVTPYDGGVTGVLTGGVMLGRRPRPPTVA